ncbi:MAG: hypothetical protein TEF_14910 [Rhizobiales bacterium NRL2]|jgi:hypothetical protein|nr:MAG: hypothetical protein TEF_14910 [Rhizobiales bacterium NRL2]
MTLAEQQAFRAEFRHTIPAGYSGVRHGLTALGIGLAFIALFLWALDAPLAWTDLAMIAVGIVGWNFVEWWVHARVLHQPRKNRIARALYQRHTHTHHRFFTRELARYEGTRDLKIVFFPVFALPATLLLSTPVAGLAWLAISANAALLLLATVAAMYILFEVMHFCAHMPDNAFVRHAPLIAMMRRHHIAHHEPSRMMRANMNFTFPLFDWLFGAVDTGPAPAEQPAE